MSFNYNLLYNNVGDNMIKYPSGKRKQSNNKQSFTANRGMNLEDDINTTNNYYLANNIANIHKKPTPIQVVKVDYPARNKAKISEAYYRQASTTDYNGVYKGKAIDFEAKETKSRTSFPLSSLHEHQIKHLRSVSEHGAIAFLIIRFTELDQTYLAYAKNIFNFLDTNTRKSIPLKWFEEYAYIIEYKYQLPCDYIGIINEHLNKESFYEET